MMEIRFAAASNTAQILKYDCHIHHSKVGECIQGAEASAIVYSLVETAKANKLKIYEYLKHLLTEIPKHMDSSDRSFLDDLLPWSEKLPEECRKKI